MSIDDLLDDLDDLVENAKHVPLTGSLCFMDAEKVRGIIDDVRLNLPQEVRQARAIVADRTEIIRTAKKEAETIIRNAENRARALVAQDAIVTSANARAEEILTEAKKRSKDMKIAAADYADQLLKHSEEDMTSLLTEVRKARQALKAPVKLRKK